LCEDAPSEVTCEDYCVANRCLFYEYNDTNQCTPGLVYQSNTYCEDLLENVLKVWVLLEGAGIGGDATGINAYLPLTQPFSGPPWLYNGTESVLSMPADAVDWLLLELRYGLDASTTVARKAVLLLSDGKIVDTSGSAGHFMRGGASAYVVVRSRTHLDVMSETSYNLFPLGAGVEVDFRVDDLGYGTNAQKDLGLGLFALYAGDANGDGSVQALDFNDYISQTTTGAAGYQTGDFNMDGQVQALDFNLYLSNTLAGVSSQVP
jgi:hypothetical protein